MIFIQVHSKFHIVKTSIFLYHKETQIFYQLLNMLLEDFRKTFAAITRTAVYTYTMFLSRFTSCSLVRLPNERSMIKPHSRPSDFFLLSEFRNVPVFPFQRNFWISQVIFLNFSRRLLINSKKILVKIGHNNFFEIPKNISGFF